MALGVFLLVEIVHTRITQNSFCTICIYSMHCAIGTELSTNIAN